MTDGGITSEIVDLDVGRLKYLQGPIEEAGLLIKSVTLHPDGQVDLELSAPTPDFPPPPEGV